MRRWLIKEEPTHYAFEQLVRDGATDWSGVKNPTARMHLRAMRRGDLAFFYHSGDVRAAVGIVTIDSDPAPDPTTDANGVTVRVRPVGALPRPVTLAEIRADPAFRGFDLLRISRLSVLPVPDAMWRRIEAIARTPALATGARAGPARASGRPRRGASARRRR